MLAVLLESIKKLEEFVLCAQMNAKVVLAKLISAKVVFQAIFCTNRLVFSNVLLDFFKIQTRYFAKNAIFPASHAKQMLISV